MDSLIPLFRRGLLSPKAKDQIPMSEMAPSKSKTSGLLRLPLEIRLDIYAHLFSRGRIQSADGKSEKHMVPFNNLSSGLIFANHQLLAETVDYVFLVPRISFPRPELCSFILMTCPGLLHRLTTLEVTLKAYETYLLDPIFNLIIAARTSLTRLTLNLVPTYPGELIFPVPRYIILRQEFQLRAAFEGGIRPWAPRCFHDHSFFVYHINDFGADSDTGSCRLSIGRLESLRYLAVTGQPELSPEFEMAILRLHGGMRMRAMREGKEVELAECCGLQNGAFHFEAWIP